MQGPTISWVLRTLLYLAGILVGCYLLYLVTGMVTARLSGGAAGDTPGLSSSNRLPPGGSMTIATGFTGQVVKIVHQSWVNRQLPRLFSQWSKSFPKCFPDYQYRLWTDENNRQLIAKYYPWFLPRYDSYSAGVQKADVSRLFYMYHYGGVYCDLDCECLRNFQHLLVNTSLAFGSMHGLMIHSRADPAFVPEGQIENSFMYSRPRHPFFWDLILRLNASTSGMAIMSTGPYLIMSGIHSARKLGIDRVKVDGLPYFTIYPPQHFNPYSWIFQTNPHCRLYGKFSEEQLQKCRDSFAGSYVVQYHTQVWDKGKNIAHQR